MAPAFLTAAIYLCLSRIIIIYGTEVSRFKPRTYTLVFCTCDIISLLLQSLGGAIAATSNSVSSSNLGKNIMLAGLAWQVFSMVIFGLCSGEYAYRLWKTKRLRNPQHIELINSGLFQCCLFGKVPHLPPLLLHSNTRKGLAIASVAILIRCIYRCIELSGGFEGKLFTSDQGLFMVLEGAMIIVAASCLTFLYPAVCFQGAWDTANFTFRTGKSGQN